MRANTHFIVPSSKFKLAAGAEQFLTTYSFGTHTAKHTFCKLCGITSFYFPRSNPDGVAVTVSCVDPGTIIHVEISSERIGSPSEWVVLNPSSQEVALTVSALMPQSMFPLLKVGGWASTWQPPKHRLKLWVAPPGNLGIEFCQRIISVADPASSSHWEKLRLREHLAVGKDSALHQVELPWMMISAAD
ncbi:hypothetical protein ZIOFF_026037 [Zingiber officinale]|uniref:CENP-V/GFA domain-containing protein n=1 Tax=Zingiber officinale TaxID=94328 RepID=A0A8J5H3G4_ZINOF|nr:hypothetical protein ZIOFF_026037 [Zingiber officinale]